jgi:enterochelin esterase family protein
VSAAQVLRHLEEQRQIPAVATVFVSSDGPAPRHSDYVCSSAYADFLACELLPHVEARLARRFDDAVLVGLSLSGLAAAHAALTTSRFSAAVCQSPSLWWEGERFASSLPIAGDNAPRFWISVGDLETDCGVSHPPSGIFQGVSQLDSCERGAAALRSAGYQANYRVFRGGHDGMCWRDDLAMALPWATSAVVLPHDLLPPKP